MGVMMLTAAQTTGYASAQVLNTPQRAECRTRQSCGIFTSIDFLWPGSAMSEKQPEMAKASGRLVAVFKYLAASLNKGRTLNNQREKAMNALRVLTSEIRLIDGLYSLNDLHKAAGGADKHRPTFFMRLDTTQALMTEIRCADLHTIASRIITGRGKPQGTYVCKELVYAYAMWVSPSFHLKVIRAFDAMQQSSAKRLQLPIDAFITMHTAASSLAGQRYLVTFNDEGTGYRAKPVPNDACVMTIEQFVKSLGDCNVVAYPNLLADLIDAVAHRVKRHMEYSRYMEQQVIDTRTRGKAL